MRERKKECTSCSQFSPCWNEFVSPCVFLAIRQRLRPCLYRATCLKSAELVYRLEVGGWAWAWLGLG